MGYYMIQAAYTPEAWATQIKNPQNVVDRVGSAIEGLGGKIVGAWYSFGDYDIVAIAEYPDDVSAAAFSMAAAAGGSVRAAKTTPLLTVEDGMDAMKKAGGSSYKPPS